MQKDERIVQLKQILSGHGLLSRERYDTERDRTMISYYRTGDKTKKMLFYIISYKGKISFGINDYKTDFLKTIPTLSGFADRHEKYMLKFDIKTLDDIQTKAIAKVVELCMLVITDKIN